MKRLKKKLSGMTLVEVLVALVLFTILALTFTTIFSYAARMNRRNYSLNRKFDNQIAYAMNESKDIGTNDQGKVTTADFTITFNDGTPSVSLEADVFEITIDEYGHKETETGVYSEEYADSYNYKYFATKYQPWGTTDPSAKTWQ